MKASHSVEHNCCVDRKFLFVGYNLADEKVTPDIEKVRFITEADAKDRKRL